LLNIGNLGWAGAGRKGAHSSRIGGKRQVKRAGADDEAGSCETGTRQHPDSAHPSCMKECQPVLANPEMQYR